MKYTQSTTSKFKKSNKNKLSWILIILVFFCTSNTVSAVSFDQITTSYSNGILSGINQTGSTLGSYVNVYKRGINKIENILNSNLKESNQQASLFSDSMSTSWSYIKDKFTKERNIIETKTNTVTQTPPVSDHLPLAGQENTKASIPPEPIKSLTPQIINNYYSYTSPNITESKIDNTLLDRIRGLELAVLNNITFNTRQTDRVYDSVNDNISSSSTNITEDGILNDTTLNRPSINNATITASTFSGSTATYTGNVTAPTFTGNLVGNSDTVTNGIYTTGSYSDPSWLSISKTKVGLSNVDNTTDLNKPISTATSSALDLKVNTSRTVNGHPLSSDVTVTPTDLGLVIGTDVLAYRTFGSAANSLISDFVAARTFGTAANNNTGDFLAYNAKATDSELLDSHDSTYFYPASNPNLYITDGNTNWDNSYNYITATDTHTGLTQSTTAGNSYFTGGNVGVGTTNPTEKFTVAGGNIAMRNLAGGGSSPSSNGILKFYGNSESSDVTYYAGIESYRVSYANVNDLRFYTSSGDATERMRITEIGNVGIGTGSPRARLNIKQASNDGVPELGTARDGLIVAANNNNYGLNIGIDPTGFSWIQAMRFDSQAISYALSLQPSGGNVGIGTAGPSEKLHVIGSILSSNLAGSGNRCVYVTAAGVLSAKGFDCGSASGGDNLGDHVATQNLQLGNYYLSGDGGNEGVFVSSTGNVGVGTNTPTGKLEVSGSVDALRLSGTDGQQLRFMTSSADAAARSFAFATNQSALGDFVLRQSITNVGDPISQVTTRFSIKPSGDVLLNQSSGNVGIGTTNPDSKFHVDNQVNTAYQSGASIVDATTFATIAGEFTNYKVDADYSAIRLATRSSGSAVWDIANIYRTTAAGDLAFRARDTSTTSKEVMRLTYGGNVGIGTTGPAAVLDVRGSGDVLQAKSTGSLFALIDRGANTNYGAVKFLTNGTSDWIIGNRETSDSNLHIFSYGTVADAMVIERSTGNVGIGTTAPAAKLHIETASTAGVAEALRLRNNNAAAGVGASIDFYADSTNKNARIRSYAVDANEGDIYLEPANGTNFATAMVIKGSGNVGIGTTTPTTGLHISGAYPTGYLTVERLGINGAGFGGVTSFQSDAKTAGDAVGISFVSQNSSSAQKTYSQIYSEIINATAGSEGGSLHFYTMTAGSSTSKMTINSLGNVGIGTTAPNEKLEVNGNIKLSAANPFLMLNATGGSHSQVRFYSNDVYKGGIYKGADDNMAVVAVSGQSLGLYVDGGSTAAMTVQATNGNVGIGTTGPVSNLDISASGGTILSLANTADLGNGSALGAINFYSKDPSGSGGAQGEMASVRGFAGNSVWDGTPNLSAGYLSFYTKAQSASVSEKVRITESGNVGIGTTVPGYKLEVSGTTGVFKASGNTATYASPLAYFTDSATNYADLEIYSDATNAMIGPYLNKGLQFVRSSGTPTVTINNSGNVGIGTTDPGAYKLNVNGDAMVSSLAIKGTSTTAGYNAVISNSETSFDIYGSGVGGSGKYLTLNPTGGLEGIRILSSGNVGIGTTGPAEKLTVTDGKLFLTTVDNTIGGKIYGYNDTGNGTYFGGLKFQTRYYNGAAYEYVDRVTINSLGNVGIGTTGPAAKLHVNVSKSGITTPFDAASDFILSNSNGTNNTSSTFEFNDGGTIAAGISAQYYDTTNDYATLNFATRGANGWNANVMTLKNGNVGIGTTAPGAQLDVQGNGSTSFPLLNLSTGTTDGSTIIRFTPKATHYNWEIGPQILTNDTFQIIPSTAVGGTTFSTAAVTIKSDGNVGIGTTSPVGKLQVVGTSDGTNDTAGIQVQSIYFDTMQDGFKTTNAAQPLIYGGRRFPDNGSGAFPFNEYGELVFQGGTRSGYNNGFSFVTGSAAYPSAASPTVKLRITEDGSVGIGTTGPGQKLEINGGYTSANTGTPATSGTTQRGIMRLTPGAVSWGAGEVLDFGMNVSPSYAWIQPTNKSNLGLNYNLAINPNGGFVGIGMTNPSVALDVTGDIEYTGTITDVSDERLKENILNITGEDALNIIKNLQAKSFNMKDTGKKEYGFIAQEVQPIFPDSISIIDPTTGYLGISYMSFIPLATESIKELDLKIEGINNLDTENSLRSVLISWFSNAANGVTDFFANRVRTKEICVAKADGTEFCVNGDQLELMASTGSIPPSSSSSSGDATSSPAEDQSQEPSSTPDTTPPTITLTGLAEVTLTVGDTYIDEGATAVDEVDGDITVNVIKGGTYVDTSTAGTYTITYNVSDAAGNNAVEVVRTIIVN